MSGNRSQSFEETSRVNYGKGGERKEISAAILSQLKVEVKPSQIVLKTNLNKIGKYTADINFHSEVSAQISIQIDKIQSV